MSSATPSTRTLVALHVNFLVRVLTMSMIDHYYHSSPDSDRAGPAKIEHLGNVSNVQVATQSLLRLIQYRC